jgi:hypothetical protein
MQVLKDLFGSKKGIAAMAGVLSIVATSLGYAFLSETALMQLLGILGAFIVGQGLADIGKEAAKVQQTADAVTHEDMAG